MKILIVCNTDSFSNPYVRTLYGGLKSQDCDITCSIEQFWNHPLDYDIIHFQWPNVLVKGAGKNCENLQRNINRIKKHKRILICTCHNISPHYDEGKEINLAYKIIYENCNVIHHFGTKSIQLVKSAYPQCQAKHVVIPHHTYDKLYSMDVDKITARSKLQIPIDTKVILAFGSFRNDEERNLVISLKRQMDGNYYFLVPGFFYRKILRTNLKKALVAAIKTLWYSYKAKVNGLHMTHHFIPDDSLPLYMASADVLLIQRLRILNSGNVPLGMLAGLPIVGPNDGNVEELLRNTGNYVFDRNDLAGLPDIIKAAISNDDIGKKNRICSKNFSTDRVSAEFINLYKSLFQKMSYEKAL